MRKGARVDVLLLALMQTNKCSNILSKTAGEGEKELAVVNEEIRALKIAVADLERSLHVRKRFVP
jgi:hypothetical protein